MQESLEEDCYQGQQERQALEGADMSNEEWRKCVVKGEGYPPFCITPLGNLVGFFVENG